MPMDEEYGEQTPMQDIVSRLDAMIADPKLATPEALTGIRDDVADMQGMLDGDEREGMEDSPEEKEGPSLLISIGKMKKGRGMK